MEFKTRIDWLSITGRVDQNEGDPGENYLLACIEFGRGILRWLGLSSPAIQTVSAAKWYEVSIVDANTGYRINFGNNLSVQGWQVVISGKAYQEHDCAGYLSGFIELYKAKITRADIAVDLIWSGLKIADFAEEYKMEHGHNGSKSWSFIKGKSGDTCYIGSRTSERMLRFYDKGGEQNIQIDWVRVELECKGGNAQRIMEVYLHDYRAVVAEITEFINTPTSSLARVLCKIGEGAVIERIRPPAVVTDRIKWLSGQVLQSFTKLCLEDYQAASDVLLKYQQTWIATGLWIMLESEKLQSTTKSDKL